MCSFLASSIAHKGFSGEVRGRSVVCSYRDLLPSKNERKGYSRHHPTPTPLCVCFSFPMSLWCFWQRGASSLPEGQWLTARALAGGQPASTRAAAGGGPCPGPGPGPPTKGLRGAALPAGLRPHRKPCPGASHPANASVSGRSSEKPACQCFEGGKKKSSSCKTVPAQPGVLSASEQTKTKPKASSRGRRSHTPPGIFRAVSKNTKPAVLPSSHAWSEPEPGVCCCVTPEERFAVVEVTTAILGRECLRFSIDFHDHL